MDVADKIVVITGASSGLGKELARVLVREGARVVATSHDAERLLKAAKEVGAAAMPADVTDETQVASLARWVVEQYGGIDIWVNNAGVWVPRAPVEKQNMKKVQDMFSVNVYGTMNGTRAALVHMYRQRHGVIVNIISDSGLHPRPNGAMYAASKWAVTGFTRSVREEARQAGIAVVGVYPGGIKTEIFGAHRPPEYETFLEPGNVAQAIVENLMSPSPQEEQVIV